MTMKRMKASLVIGVMLLSELGVTAKAQRTSAETADSGKTYELLPGLDKRLIDTTADPCVDFFQYACGNFTKLYPIPNDRSSFGTGAMIVEHTQQVLHTMLEKAAVGSVGRNSNEHSN